MEELFQKNVTKIDIDEELQQDYIDYAMSVIVGRAIPDLRDGLKPVQRRILFAMNELGRDIFTKHKKSARVVGDVIGKYHPHGDSSVYAALVRMAQDFSIRYPLVDGQGNFGSIDGDSPAAMRYTEARLAKISLEFLKDLDKETVDFRPNYDGSLNEPSVLPTTIPNFLVNGTSGIAVAFATDVPPHNLTEVLNAAIALIDNPEITLEELLTIVKGPDLPTGALLYGGARLHKAYQTGRGSFLVEGKIDIETVDKKQALIVTEIPYSVKKNELIEKIERYRHSDDKTKPPILQGVDGIRDESSREGMRIVIFIKRDYSPEYVLNLLYKHTRLRTTISMIMLGLDGAKPRVIGLKPYLEVFRNYRVEIITNRLNYELRESEKTAHILEGLKIALENIDEVIRMIKASSSRKEAKSNLIERFKFSEIQTDKILDMRLHKLTGLERDKIIEDYNKIMARIAELKDILSSYAKILNEVRKELLIVRDTYGTGRKTVILNETPGDINLEDLIKKEDVVISVTKNGYIKRMSLNTKNSQKRGGKGNKVQKLDEGDYVSSIYVAFSHDYTLFFTEQGRCFWIKNYEIRESKSTSKGTYLRSLFTKMDENDKIVAVLPIKSFDTDDMIVMVTNNGYVKKTSLEVFKNARKNGIKAMSNLTGKDIVTDVKIVKPNEFILISTREGKAICIKENDLRVLGRSARGVKGIKLLDDNEVVGVTVIENMESKADYLLTIYSGGYGKRTRVGAFRPQNRGGVGIKAGKITAAKGKIIAVMKVKKEDEIMLVSDGGLVIRIPVKNISVQGRDTTGVKLMNLDSKTKVVAISKVLRDEELANKDLGLLDK